MEKKKNKETCVRRVRIGQRVDQEYARYLGELKKNVPTGSINLLNAGLLKVEGPAKSFVLFPTDQSG